jgi:trans-2,3-dihydro-3-hydroxyanthranilate isomerase
MMTSRTGSEQGRDVAVVHTTVFAAPGVVDGGNPCPVVVDAQNLTSHQMQAIALRFGYECGFVVSGPEVETPELRFFVPEHEMSMCVHATAACVALLVEDGRLSAPGAAVRTGIGTVPVSWAPVPAAAAPDHVEIGMPTPQRMPGHPRLTDVAEVLGLEGGLSDVGRGPVEVWNAARPKLLFPVADRSRLNSMTPVWEAMWALCSDFDATGIYAFAPGDEPHAVHARQFPVRAGYPEDAATGVAAAALGGYLATSAPPKAASTVRYEVHQGEAMGSPSLLETVIGWDGATVVSAHVAGPVRIDRRTTTDPENR